MKHFVLDTNVLLHNPSALFMFADNEVIIPFDVIEELDRFKTANTELGRNAREVVRALDRLEETHVDLHLTVSTLRRFAPGNRPRSLLGPCPCTQGCVQAGSSSDLNTNCMMPPWR